MMDFPADFIIHVDESLTREQLDRLEDAVRENACAASAGVHDKTPHLMLVAYNPDCVTGQGLRAAAPGLCG